MQMDQYISVSATQSGRYGLAQSGIGTIASISAMMIQTSTGSRRDALALFIFRALLRRREGCFRLSAFGFSRLLRRPLLLPGRPGGRNEHDLPHLVQARRGPGSHFGKRTLRDARYRVDERHGIAGWKSAAEARGHEQVAVLDVRVVWQER